MGNSIIVDLPDGSEAEFPEGTPLPTIQAAIQKKFPPKQNMAPPQPSEPSVNMVASSIYRPALEYGGMAAGAAGGMASPIPGGSVMGAGLGYGIGKGVADLLDQWVGLKKTTSTGEKFAQAGKDVLAGGAMEAGGQLLGAGISKIGAAIAESGAAQRTYASAVKMPLSQKWVKARGPAGTSDVKMAVGKGLAENIPPTELGLAAAKSGKANAADAIDAEISKMTGTFSTQDILTNGMRNAVDMARKGEAPAKDMEKVIQYTSNLLEGRQANMNATELNDLKKELYKLANYDKLYGKADSLVETMRKGVAHEARLQLQANNPALKDVNADYASWRLLEEALERSLARRNNRDLIDLGTKVMIGRESLPLAILNQIITPNVKSHVAFMLKNADKVTGATISRPAAYTGYHLLGPTPQQ